VNFAVCPYDGINLKAVGQPPGLAGSLPMRCPECGRRFELADGEVIEPPDAMEDDSKA
jgi:nitrite reductase/ring-hydroxylating ferredoxin subunit